MAMPAAANSSQATRICAGRLIRHLRDLFRLITFQQFPRVRRTEPGVLRFNAQEEAVTAGAHKVRRIEYWVIGLRQAIQPPHAKYCRQARAQHRTFKRYRNECRPGMEWLATHID